MDDPHRIGGKAGIGRRLRPATRRLILNVLKEIDPPHRDVLWMHDAEGRPVAAIATALSIPPGRVQARLREARRKFRFAVTHLRRRSIPFADELPTSLSALQHADGDGPDVPFDPCEDLLRHMALALRVLNPVSLAASLAPEDRPPESSVRDRPRPTAKPRRPGQGA